MTKFEKARFVGHRPPTDEYIANFDSVFNDKLADACEEFRQEYFDELDDDELCEPGTGSIFEKWTVKQLLTDNVIRELAVEDFRTKLEHYTRDDLLHLLLDVRIELKIAEESLGVQYED